MLCQVPFTLQKIALMKYQFVTHEPEGTPMNFSDFCQQQMFQSLYLQVRRETDLQGIDFHVLGNITVPVFL